MWIKILAFLELSTVALALPTRDNLQRRSVNIQTATTATIVADFKTINTQLDALTSTVNDYEGGNFGALPIQRATTTVSDSVSKLNNDVSGLTPQTDEQAQMILDAVVASEASIKPALDAIVAKKTTFPRNLKPQVTTGLDTLSKSTAGLGATFATKTSDGFRQKVNDESAKIDQLFVSASSNFA